MSVSVEEISEALGLSKEELIRRGVRAYLELELKRINSEIMTLYRRYNVNSLRELDEKISRGELSETDTFDDFTRLDYLEAKRDEVEKFLRSTG
ncbi:MAG: hypothetical protein Q6352_006925 [Candidatus Freyrarchaeum guaymaensis]|nr:hypothetical protein [Candidatus Sigynarchaeota archaeon]